MGSSCHTQLTHYTLTCTLASQLSQTAWEDLPIASTHCHLLQYPADMLHSRCWWPLSYFHNCTNRGSKVVSASLFFLNERQWWASCKLVNGVYFGVSIDWSIDEWKYAKITTKIKRFRNTCRAKHGWYYEYQSFTNHKSVGQLQFCLMMS